MARPFTYYLKDSLLTDKEVRQQAEKEMVKEKKYPKYPSWEQVEAENLQPKPSVYIEVTDTQGNVIKRVEGKTTKGLHRITWDMTFAPQSAITKLEEGRRGGRGPMVPAGSYKAALFKREDGVVTQLAAPVDVELEPIYEPSLEGPSSQEAQAFSKKLMAVDRQFSSLEAVFESLEENMSLVRKAINRTPGDISELEAQYAALTAEINEINHQLYGLESRERMGIKPPNVASRLGYAMSALWSSYGPTTQHKQQLGYALDGIEEASKRVKALQDDKVPALQNAIIKADGPWTKGADMIL